MIQAVVYTSNTGSTEQYARLLGQETGLPVCSLTEARKTLSAGTQILYLGWVMAGSIQGYADAARLFKIPMVCAVGMEPDAKQQELREKNGIPQDAALYALQGGYSPDRLRGIQKLMMRMITGSMAKRFQPIKLRSSTKSSHLWPFIISLERRMHSITPRLGSSTSR